MWYGVGRLASLRRTPHLSAQSALTVPALLSMTLYSRRFFPCRCLTMQQCSSWIICHGLLQEGGLWINLGPLLYHWADAHTYLPEGELSIELSLEEVEAAAAQIGFKTLQREIVPSAYMANLK